nr:uncharacterized protein [uncultured bacterium]
MTFGSETLGMKQKKAGARGPGESNREALRLRDEGSRAKKGGGAGTLSTPGAVEHADRTEHQSSLI